MKKYNFRSLALVSLILVFTMCAKEEQVTDDPAPVAAFTFTGDDMPAPQKVFFTNASTNALTYIWDFGDGDLSQLESPSHIYQQGGSYKVSLYAVKGDRQHIVTKTVVIHNRPHQVKMSQLTLTDYPEKDNGVSWDTDSPPDVFYRITNYIGSVLFTSEVISDLPVTGLPANYTQDLPFTFEGLNTVYLIKFYDYDDTLSYGYLGSYYFTMNLFVPADGSGYPSELEFNSSGSPVKFRLAVDWIYEDYR